MFASTGHNTNVSEFVLRYSDSLCCIYPGRYGETSFWTLAHCLAELHSLGALPTRHTGCFVDLGCGLGNVLYAAQLLWGFQTAAGYESNADLLTPAVVKQAEEYCSKAQTCSADTQLVVDGTTGVESNTTDVTCCAIGAKENGLDTQVHEGNSGSVDPSECSRVVGACSCCAGRIRLHCADMCADGSWAVSGDVVFAHSICFGPELMGRLLAATEQMKDGSAFVCMTPNAEFNRSWLTPVAKAKLPTSYSAAYFYSYVVRHTS
jgi:hypothetical protein